MKKIISYGKNDASVRNSLKLARDTYGYKNQLMVSIEELNELSAILAKIPRYDTVDDAMDSIKDKITDEVSDVLIILDHIINICDISDADIEKQINYKVSRLARWLASSDKISQTTIDREIV